MGAKQSKRSVDITTTPKKGNGEVLDTIEDGKVVKIAADLDIKVTTNGAAIEPSTSQENTTSDNCDDKIVINGHGDEEHMDLAAGDVYIPVAEQNGQKSDDETTPETEQITNDQSLEKSADTISTEETTDKKKKEKSKKKWSFRSISFSKKDKSKPTKDAEKNGLVSEVSEVPEVPEVPDVLEVPNSKPTKDAENNGVVSEVSEVPEVPEVLEVSEVSKVPEVPKVLEVLEVPKSKPTKDAETNGVVSEVSEVTKVPEVTELLEVPEVHDEASEVTVAPTVDEIKTTKGTEAEEVAPKAEEAPKPLEDSKPVEEVKVALVAPVAAEGLDIAETKTAVTETQPPVTEPIQEQVVVTESTMADQSSSVILPLSDLPATKFEPTVESLVATTLLPDPDVEQVVSNTVVETLPESVPIVALVRESAAHIEAIDMVRTNKPVLEPPVTTESKSPVLTESIQEQVVVAESTIVATTLLSDPNVEQNMSNTVVETLPESVPIELPLTTESQSNVVTEPIQEQVVLAESTMADNSSSDLLPISGSPATTLEPIATCNVIDTPDTTDTFVSDPNVAANVPNTVVETLPESVPIVVPVVEATVVAEELQPLVSIDSQSPVVTEPVQEPVVVAESTMVDSTQSDLVPVSDLQAKICEQIAAPLITENPVVAVNALDLECDELKIEPAVEQSLPTPPDSFPPSVVEPLAATLEQVTAPSPTGLKQEATPAVAAAKIEE